MLMLHQDSATIPTPDDVYAHLYIMLIYLLIWKAVI